MHVNIGPYPDNPEEDRYIDVRLESYDVWNMDNTLAQIILPMLKLLKTEKHGSPVVDAEDVPEHLQVIGRPRNESMQYDMFADDEYDTMSWQITHDRWDWVLDEMIWAFEQHLSDWEDQYWTGESDTWLQPVDKEGNKLGPAHKFGEDHDEIPGVELYEMIEGPNHTRVWDKEGYFKHAERMANGMKLFGKYYQGLWS